MHPSSLRSLALLLIGLLGWQQLSTAQAQVFQPGRPQTDEIFLLAPRALMRLLREGEAAIADGRYADGINALGALLLDDSGELPDDLRGQDFFVEVGARGLYQKSVKGEASRLLSELPPEGRRTLEIQFGVTARQQLEAATAERDFDKIGEVARKYLHTEAGYDAHLLMAQYQLTQGYPLAAAGILQNLLDYPAARQRYGAELASAAATAWLQAGQPELAAATLQMASRDFSGQSITVGGLQIPMSEDTDWQSVLESQQDRLPATSNQVADAWLTAGGNAQRNAQVSGGLPLANARWVKEIHSSVPERESLLEVEEVARKTGNVILPKFELRMADGMVITKTTDGGVLGIDFESGNTQWVHYFGSSAAPLKSFAWGNSYGNEDLVSKELQDRVWGSSAFGRFSCDPERFYYISTEGEQPMNPSNFFAGRSSPKNSNYLEGVSIAAQGAILWRVGGQTGEDEPRLAGAYFLGPPLPYEGRLYSLIEMNGETKLVVLDPTSGRLQWMQQLAHAVFRPIQIDELRQGQALSPTIAEGVVLCPTGVGAVVAVDLLSRSLRWGATYRPSVSTSPNRFGGAFGMNTIEYMPLGRRWEDSAMIAERGALVVSPPDSDFLFCRDVLTGEAIVTSHPRRNARYVAGIHGDELILVSETGVSALGMSSKRLTWDMEFPAGHSLAGKGLWQKDTLLLPLTGKRVIRVRLADGAITGEATVDQELGNLFAFQDQLLSVNSTSIAAYYTVEALGQQVDERLAANPNDTWALNQKSQLLHAEGDIEQAMELLAKSYALDPTSADTRYLTVETLLEALQSDFDTYAHLADELDDLVEFGPQRFRFLQQLALGKTRSGDNLAAFERLFELMDYQIEMAYSGSQGRGSKIRLSDRHAVDSDAWIATELARVYERATATEREQMAQRIQAELARVEGTMIPLRRQRLRYLAWTTAAQASTLALAAELLGGQEQTTAEQLLQPVLYGKQATPRETGLELLRQPAQADRWLLGPAGRSYASPSDGLPPGTSDGGAPPVANPPPPAGAAADGQEPVGEVIWHQGGVAYQAIKELSMFPVGNPLEVVGERYGRPEIAVALSDSLLAIANENGENVGHLSFNPATSDASSGYTKARVRGGLLILETVSEVAAFDLYSGLSDRRDGLLWRYSLVGATPNEQYIAPGMNAPNAELGISIPSRQIPGDQQASVGPLTPAALVVQNGTTIVGLDPLTGKQLWLREGYGADIRMACGELEVALVNPSEGKTEIVDCRDGSLIRQREYRGTWKHWFSHGPMMVDLRREDSGTNVNVRIWNSLSGEVFQDLSVPFSARAEVCESRYLVIANPRRQLIYVDLQSLVYRELAVPVDRDLAGISVERFDDRIVVLSNPTPSRQRQFARSLMYPIDGSIYAIDAATGDLAWSRPGQLSDMAFPISQPRHSPFLVACRFSDADSSGAARATVAMLDLRDGRLVFSDDAIMVRTTTVQMRLKPLEQKLDLAIGDRTYRFTFTEGERPPQPVVSFGHDYNRSARRRATSIFPGQ